VAVPFCSLHTDTITCFSILSFSAANRFKAEGSPGIGLVLGQKEDVKYQPYGRKATQENNPNERTKNQQLSSTFSTQKDTPVFIA